MSGCYWQTPASFVVPESGIEVRLTEVAVPKHPLALPYQADGVIAVVLKRRYFISCSAFANRGAASSNFFALFDGHLGTG